MKSLKQKRQQLAKQIRSKQRNQIFSQNRRRLYDSYEDESLVTLIFLMIDKDQQEISAESFDDFLQIISQEIFGSQIEERKINDGIAQAILQRYGSMLSEFLDNVKNTVEEQRVSLITKNKKQFDLVRFLIRLQVIQEQYLILINSLLQSASLKLNRLTESLSSMSENNTNNSKNNQQIAFQELITTLSSHHKLYKQITYLYFLTRQQQQCPEGHQNNLPSVILKQTIKENICQLTQKWMVNNHVIGFFYSTQLVSITKSSHQHQQKILRLFQQYKNLYLNFLLQHEDMFQKVINVNIEDKLFNNSNKNKIVQLLFVLFSSIQKQSHQTQEKDLGQQNKNTINEEIILFTHLSLKIIKCLQFKFSQCQNNKQSSQNKIIYQNLLKCLIDSFVQSSITKVFTRFLQQQTITNKDTKNAQKIIESYCTLNKCNLNNKETQKYQFLLIIKLLHSIQDFQYHDLVTFVQLLSIIISYNDTVINILFKARQFQGYYDKKLNFQIILQKKLLRHVSGQIRRRAVWMLSNITGSEEFYYYGLGFIKNLYVDNVFQNDGINSSEMTKQDALIKESLLQVVMNYLSNIRSYKEIQQLLSYHRDQNTQSEKEDFANFHSKNHKQNDNKQPLLIWIIQNLSSVVENLSNNTVIVKQTQKFIEVLIYSLYNLLTIEEYYKQQQNEKNQQHIVLSIMETYSIPKNLQTIYHNSQTTNQYSTFFTMMETLLDLINKVKNQN